LNKLKANIIKANAIPKEVLFRKLNAVFFSKQKEKNLPVDEFTFNGIGETVEISPNLEPFFKVLPQLDDADKHINKLREYCNDFLNHEFDLLGSGVKCVDLQMSKEKFIEDGINNANREVAYEIYSHIDNEYNLINWNTDFVSGYNWDNSKKSQILSYEDLDGVDVKLPWELGRLQHFIPMAYLASKGNDEFFLELKNQLFDFIASNPPGYGIQWKSPMDVAIRAVSLIFAYSILKKHNIETDKYFDNLLYASIKIHVVYIFKHLEWNDGLRGNHYLFNLLGLIAGSIFLNKEFQTDEIFVFSLKEFKKEILYQFNEDGGNFEASVPYHFFTVETVFLSNNLLENTPLELFDNEELQKRKRNIIRFTLANADRNGRISQIGDNDSGYLIKLYPEDILNDSELSVKHILRYINEDIENGIFNFDKFGIHIRKNDDMFFTFRFGKVGQKGKGGHAHNDALSFTLRYKDVDFFVDPGTYCYLPYPEIRNKFRSTGYHNTLSVKGKEQNLIFDNSSEDLFWMIDRANPQMISLSDSLIHAVHTGFGNKAERIINFEQKKITCTDKLTCTNICTLPEDKQVNFHLHPDVKITEENKQLVLTNGKINIRFSFGENTYYISNYDYSPGYGKKMNAKKITLFSHSRETNWEIIF
jgi:hypothetical protein